MTTRAGPLPSRSHKISVGPPLARAFLTGRGRLADGSLAEHRALAVDAAAPVVPVRVGRAEADLLGPAPEVARWGMHAIAGAPEVAPVALQKALAVVRARGLARVIPPEPFDPPSRCRRAVAPCVRRPALGLGQALRIVRSAARRRPRPSVSQGATRRVRRHGAQVGSRVRRGRPGWLFDELHLHGKPRRLRTTRGAPRESRRRQNERERRALLVKDIHLSMPLARSAMIPRLAASRWTRESTGP